MKPAISAVVVSDYAPSESKELSHFRRCLRALADQDIEEPVEVIVVSAGPFSDEVVSEFEEMIADLKTFVVPEASSFQMKNFGARRASSDLVAFLDADCFAYSNWLRVVVEEFRKSSADAITGRTVYEDPSLSARSFCLIGRALLDAGRRTTTRRLANHSCALRRAVVLEHPFPEDTTAFGGGVHAHLLRKAGKSVLFSTDMTVVHAYEGWEGEKDIRKNNGYAGIRHRQLYTDMPHAWIRRCGYFAIPVLYLARVLQSLAVCIRRWRSYGIAWFELPYTLALVPIAFAMEVPGMTLAVQRKPLVDTAYQ